MKKHYIHEFCHDSATDEDSVVRDPPGGDSRFLVTDHVVHYVRGVDDDRTTSRVMSAVEKVMEGGGEELVGLVEAEGTIGMVVDKAVRMSEGKVTVKDLLSLGAVWYAPSQFSNPESGKLNSAHVKPIRLGLGDARRHVHAGDYLRVHYNPRRFPVNKKLEIVGEDEEVGYLVVDKPCGLPCHPTVDNTVENVVTILGGGDNGTRYLGLPSRLDHDTRGLLVLATDKKFAGYYSRLLRGKTMAETTEGMVGDGGAGLVRKLYKCLVCVGEDGGERGGEKVRVMKGEIITHFLMPSIRAPKTFSAERGSSVGGKEWLECHLRIGDVGEVKDVGGGMVVKEGTVGVLEVEVELLTGRTHQIRGQLAALGFPLVGDRMYFGEEGGTGILALKCCSLRFPKPRACKFGEGGEDVIGRKKRRAMKRGENIDEKEYVVGRNEEGEVEEWLEFKLEEEMGWGDIWK